MHLARTMPRTLPVPCALCDKGVAYTRGGGGEYSSQREDGSKRQHILSKYE